MRKERFLREFLRCLRGYIKLLFAVTIIQVIVLAIFFLLMPPDLINDSRFDNVNKFTLPLTGTSLGWRIPVIFVYGMTTIGYWFFVISSIYYSRKPFMKSNRRRYGRDMRERSPFMR